MLLWHILLHREHSKANGDIDDNKHELWVTTKSSVTYKWSSASTVIDKSHSVKSYFAMNGNELNENGNVRSFFTLVIALIIFDLLWLTEHNLSATSSKLAK